MKKFVGIIGLISLIIINLLGFKIALDKAIDSIEVPVAKVKIDPRTKIDKSMIEIIQVPKVMLNEDCVRDSKDVLNKYTEIEGIIPKGSLFYKSMLFEENELPDYPTLKLQDGQNVFSLATNLVKSSGNTLTNNQLIDIYVTIKSKDKKSITDCLLKNVRILNVIDRKGNDMKESDSNIPSVINLAINKEYVALLKKASEIGTIDLYATNFPQDEECILNEESAILPALYE